jgi:hypothetical protein
MVPLRSVLDLRTSWFVTEKFAKQRCNVSQIFDIVKGVFMGAPANPEAGRRSVYTGPRAREQRGGSPFEGGDGDERS